MSENIQLGLKENWQQFSLLVLINAFVGGMVGLERSILPQLAESEFGITSHTAILSFITAFGITKAIANYFTGKLANQLGRKNLLVIGWIIALLVPIIIIQAPNWSWIIMANIFLGISQGLTWSSTVVMKIDLVGDKQRGWAMGLNEFSGYWAVGTVTFLSSWIATQYGIRPYPFYLGILMAVLGLFLSYGCVRDTRSFVNKEAQNNKTILPKTGHIFWITSFKDKTLSTVTQAGLVNNLNDGMIWGLLPTLLFNQGFKTTEIGLITAIYPTVWGISQLLTGYLSDILSKKKLLFWGMFIQGIVIILLVVGNNSIQLSWLSALLGIGTALVYPTFLATIASVTSPQDRAESIGTFRLWRDLGYAIGAIFSGFIADAWGITAAIVSVGVLTIISAIAIPIRMRTIDI